MRKPPLILASLVFSITTTLWAQYFVGLSVVRDYQLMYALFAFVPAVLLGLCLALLAIRRTWIVWVGGLLLLPTGALWVVSIMLILNDYKIH